MRLTNDACELLRDTECRQWKEGISLNDGRTIEECAALATTVAAAAAVACHL